MYTNKLGNLDKMDKLLETYRPSKLIREKKKKKTEQPYNQRLNQQFKKKTHTHHHHHLLMKKSPGPDQWFTSELYELLRTINTNPFQTLLRIEKQSTLLNSFDGTNIM